MNDLILGKQTKGTKQDCLQCLAYFTCKKPQKKQNLACEDYSITLDDLKLKQTQTSLQTAFDKLEQAEHIEATNDSSYFNPAQLGLKLPEGDFPLAKNLHEFVFSKKFLNSGTTGLYARQFGIGLNLFKEYCPKCSDLSYVEKNFEVSDSIDDILNRVVLFEHGVCPKCKANKDDLLAKHEYWEHYELAALCGQRCITGDSLVATDNGLIEIRALSNNIEGFSDYSFEHKILTTEGYVKPTKMFEAAPENLIKLVTKRGYTITGTKDHPILTETGFKKLGEIKENDCVLIKLNQQCFGKTTLDAKYTDILTSPKEFQMEFMRGLFEHNGKIERIKTKPRISYYSTSEKLIDQIQLMLANIGIVAWKKIQSKDCYILYIKGLKNILVFKENINFISTRNKERLTSAIYKLQVTTPKLPPRIKDVLFEPVVRLELTEPQKTYDFYLPPVHNFVANSFINHNSGKSLMAAIFACYVLHRFLKVADIPAAYDVAKPTIMLGTFVALDKAQIQESTWGYLSNIIKDSPWFIDYCKMLKSEGRKLGRKLHDIDKVETMEFFHKNIKLNMAAPKPAALRGRTGFCGVIDEIGFLKVKDEGRVITAEEVYAALNNRMATLTTAYENRRSKIPNLPAPLFMNISSPCHIKDKICTLVKTIKAENTTTATDKRILKRYAVHYATWEINPMFSKEGAYISSKFKSDPKEAERDFGAQAPLSANAFIDNTEALTNCSSKEKENLVSVNYDLYQDIGYTLNYSNSLYQADLNIPRALAIDLGYNNNSTALSIGYFDTSTNTTVVEALLEIIPTPGVEVRFTTLLEKVIKPLIEKLNIKLVAADSWQSISMSQSIEEQTRSKTLKYSLKYGDCLLFKSDLLNQKITYPKINDYSLLTPKNLEQQYPIIFYEKPVEHFIYQCLTVVDEKDVAVRKGEGTTDDLFRATALLHYVLNNLQLRKQMSEISKQRQLPLGPVVHVQSMKSSGGNNSNTTTKFSGSSVVVV